jgi:GH15 family glucan-1,4-alpha-glucosidase
MSTLLRAQAARDERSDGYLPIGAYAAIGDQHSVALVGRDGSIDWLCLPRFDGPFVLGALVDADRGGRFALAPLEPYEVVRRYLPGTNVLETTMRTAKGVVRVTDAMTLQPHGRRARELTRRITGVTGRVPLAWRVQPRFNHTERPAIIERSASGTLARRDGEAVTIQAWDAGEPVIDDGAVGGQFALEDGGQALLVLGARAIADGPAPFAERGKIEQRIDRTIDWWRDWSETRSYDGPWRDAVLRSGLVLKMLLDADTGAILAAPTTGLPEAVGGSRNWDYRFCWLRDSSFAVDALMRLGDDEAAGRYLQWVMNASRDHHPRLHPFYSLNGSSEIGQRPLEVTGYQGSQPVLQGNGAVDQRQLGNYGDLFQAATLYADRGHTFDDEVADRFAGIADHVCQAWLHRDSGIWELGTHRHYTASKMQCWIALDRALKLAEQGKIPDEHAAEWRTSRHRIQQFIEQRCWSRELNAYARSADVDDELDAGVLVGIFMGYETSDRARLHATVDRLRERLGTGPLIYRYTGMSDAEGTFLACAFWVVHALTRLDRQDEASTLMNQLLGLSNDVGLYSEEMAPGGEMLGNFPQALTHLALINAAAALGERRAR